MHNRIITIEELTDIVADTLGKTTDEIMHSENFEQATYDMAKSFLPNLPALDVTAKAQYGAEDQFIRITYRSNPHIADMAKFYNSYFPDTQPVAFKGQFIGEGDISFLAGPFIEKVLPAMKLWKQKPSDLPSLLHEDLEATKQGPQIFQARC